VEPTRSQNITVNWRRSASGATGRDFVAVSDAAARVAFLAVIVPWRLRLFVAGGFPVASRAMPQSPQNLAVGLTSAPQLGQVYRSLAPHSSQNFFPSGFSLPQLAQCMELLYNPPVALGKSADLTAELASVPGPFSGCQAREEKK
jgi:hypothetical protein